MLHATTIILALVILPTASGGDLSYRGREGRQEGVRSTPISGKDIALIGAMLEPLPEETETLPADVPVRFFRYGDDAVHVVVRERYPKNRYWLDSVQPTAPWRERAMNRYTWPSRDVLAPLEMKLSDLLVLIRLGNPQPAAFEKVAPAFLGTGKGPTEVGIYHFIFMAEDEVEIESFVFRDGRSGPIDRVSIRRIERPGRPFDLVWDARQQPEGSYRLVVEGLFTSDNSPIQRTVQFVHSPSWKQ